MRIKTGAIALLAVTMLGAQPSAAKFPDPLDTPAASVPITPFLPFIALSPAGSQLVAVGPRGLAGVFPVGDNGIGKGVQGAVPAQSDLVDVQMIDAQTGWACGHDGIILHTADGGLHWQVQLTGLSARPLFESYYRARIAAGRQDLAADLQEIGLNYDQGPSLPWLSVLFTDASHGFVVGSFGDIAATTDGGKSWIPWLDHIDDPNYLNLNDIAEIGDVIYIVGEQGSVFRSDAGQQNFVAIPTDYTGDLFGITGTKDFLLVYGLRGTIYRSTDQGKSWTLVTAPDGSMIVDGTILGNGDVLLAAGDGKLLISHDSGQHFSVRATTAPGGVAALAIWHGDAAFLAGLSGITRQLVR